jgi:hypothetical protein
MVGVLISVTTVPAAGYVAVAGVLGEWSQVWGSALQLLINLVGIVLSAAGMLLVRRWAQRRHADLDLRRLPDRWRRAAFVPDRSWAAEADSLRPYQAGNTA